MTFSHYAVIFCNLNLRFLIKFFSKVLFYVSWLVKYDPMRVSSYLPLPKEPNAKRGCVNINIDEKCFLWSILASLHPVQRRNNQFRVSKYQEYELELNMPGIKYPVNIKDISKLAKNLPVIYYHHDHCKASREFIIYHC